MHAASRCNHLSELTKRDVCVTATGRMNHNNNNILFYVLFLQIGAHSPLQHKAKNTVKTNFHEQRESKTDRQTDRDRHRERDRGRQRETDRERERVNGIA